MAKANGKRNGEASRKIDYALLAILQKDCMKTAVDISKELKEVNIDLGGPACGNRINALKERGYIKKSCSILDPQKFGLFQLCFMTVKMHNQDSSFTQKFLSAAIKEESILEIYEMSGFCDYLMKVLVVNVGEATKLSQKVGQGVAEIQTHPAGSAQKETTEIRLPSAD